MSNNTDHHNFLIICAARTGSTWLRKMLNDHPRIICYGEVFATRVRGFRPEVIGKQSKQEVIY